MTNMEQGWKVKIVGPGYKLDRDIYIFRPVGNGKTEILRGNLVETFENDSTPEPSLSLSPELLQEFVDALSALGVKPQKGFIEGKLEATERHLVDLQAIVFKKHEYRE